MLACALLVWWTAVPGVVLSNAGAVATARAQEEPGERVAIPFGEVLPFNYSFFENRVVAAYEAEALSVELGWVVPAGRFIVVVVRTTNRDSDDHENFDLDELSLEDAAGQVFWDDYELSEAQAKQMGTSLDAYVPAGAEVDLPLVFDVPKESTGLRLARVAPGSDIPQDWYVELDPTLGSSRPAATPTSGEPIGTVAIGDMVEAPAWDVAVTDVSMAKTLGTLNAEHFGGYYVVVTLSVRNRLDLPNAFPINQLRLVLGDGQRHLPLGAETRMYAATRGERYVGGGSSALPPVVSGQVAPGETMEVIVLFGSGLERSEYWLEPAPSAALDERWEVVPWTVYLGAVEAPAD